MTAVDPRERKLVANGLQLRTLEWEGRGPRTLLVHATSFCADAWRPVVAAIDPPLRAIAIDQRGHGGSDAPASAAAYQWTRLADDVAAIAASIASEGEADSQRMIGVGHSSGATALLAAAGAQPARFAALVAIEPVLFDARKPSDTDSFTGSSHLADAARRRRNRFASLEDARERLRAKPPFVGFDGDAFEAVLQGMLAPDAAGLTLRCPGEREAWCYEGALALDLWPLAAKIDAPLLLVEGDRGALAPALRDRLLASVPSAQRAVIPGGTHFAALERPREVAAAIARFLAGLQ